MNAPAHDEQLREYLIAPPSKPDASDLKGYAAVISRRLVPRRARLPLRTIATRTVGPASRRKLRARVEQLREDQRPILLHVGCGTEHKDGFTNIDLLGARGLDVSLDLAQGIPLPDGTVDGIFHEHVLEHLPIRVGYAFLHECLRVLKPGGVLRIAVPDAGACIDSYKRGLDATWDKGEPVPLMSVESLFYSYTHVTMYDEEKLTSLMRVAGYRDVTRREFGDTSLPIAPDTARRRHRTLYVEGVR